MTPRTIICVDELSLLVLEVVVDCPGDIILQNKVDLPTDILEAGLVLIHKAEVSGLIRIDDVNLRVGGLGEGGHSVAHKRPREGAYLI